MPTIVAFDILGVDPQTGKQTYRCTMDDQTIWILDPQGIWTNQTLTLQQLQDSLRNWVNQQPPPPPKP